MSTKNEQEERDGVRIQLLPNNVAGWVYLSLLCLVCFAWGSAVGLSKVGLRLEREWSL